MTAPATVGISNFSGIWMMNKALSDNTDDVLVAQSIGWILCRSIGLATITQTIKHTTDPETVVGEIDINQSLSGLKGTMEERTLDWKERSHSDYGFGNVMGKSRRVQLSEIDDEVLKKGLTGDTIAKGLIQSYVVNEEYQWNAEQIWGFMEIDGEQRYASRVKLTTPNLRLDKVLVI